jgi:hypothetical protein
MQLLNRTAIVVRAKGRYVDWANSVRDEGPKFTIEEARTNPGVYLVYPVVEDDEAPSDKDLIDARALPVEIDDEHLAIAVRPGEFEPVVEGYDEDEEPEDEEDEEDDEDEGDEDEEEEGWVLACCSEQCGEQLGEALGERAGVEE